MDIQCFMIEPDGTTRRQLYRLGHDAVACYGHYHRAEISLPDGLVADNEASWLMKDPYEFKKEDFPVKCDKCDYVFQEDNDHYGFHARRAWIRSDTREFICNNVHQAPAGAMWYADWMQDDPHMLGPDGKCLCVMTPGGEWMIDSRASNCSMPNDIVHKCWVRHGIPPLITVDKNGITCQAGAGSILAGNYHGFLHNGILVQA